MTRLLLSCCLLLISTLTQAAIPYGKPIHRFHTNQKVVALTFDDGPSVPYTEQILDILDKYNVKATFYVMGINAKQHPKIIQRMMLSGHELGNHSMYHHHLKRKSTQSIIKDIKQVDHILREAGYEGPITFRAPYGQLSRSIQNALVELKKYHVVFDFLPKDWENPPPYLIHDRVMKRLQPGLIITLHDGGKGRSPTVQATEAIIKSLKAQGYTFETVSELIRNE